MRKSEAWALTFCINQPIDEIEEDKIHDRVIQPFKFNTIINIFLAHKMKTTIIDEDFYIPMGDAISNFSIHLRSHERSILSAKFGDGKSFFLHEFMNDERIKNNFVFLVLHPVNYQVVENKDIFELIKRDMLFQMVNNKIYDPQYEITDAVAVAFYLQNNFQSLAYSLLPYLSFLNSDSKITSSLMAALSTVKFLKDLRERINGFKNENSESGIIHKFIDGSDSLIYENDAITKIIRGNICAYKKKNQKKRIVLIIEDMDRLDPAHLFRIMNIFSAQMDYQYLDESDPECDINGNKFGLDNVLLIMDYDNTKNIFSHFYGAGTDFDGYIQKFCNKGIFKYSLKEQQEKYIYEKIQKVTDLPLDLIKKYISSTILFEKTIRRTCSSFDDVDNQIIKHEEVEYKSKEYKLHPGMFRLFVILRRLGISDKEIISKTKSLILEKGDLILPYIAPYLLIYSRIGIDRSLKYLNVGDQKFEFRITGINDNGTAVYQKDRLLGWTSDTKYESFEYVIAIMLQGISK